jgi:isopentenyldiphosphate isomerase
MVEGVRRVESMDPARRLVSLEQEYGRERVEAVLGDGVKRLAPSERKYYLTTNRSLHAVDEIPGGRTIRAADVAILRSESNLRPGLGPEYLELVVGRTAQRTVPAGEGITWEDILPPPVELLQIVDREGNPVGTRPRSECHGNPDLIQAVVHLHLYDGAGRLYLQKRAADKDLYPGRWDTSVGGHVAPGETPDQAIRREAREELRIDLDDPGEGIASRRLERLQPYVYSDDVETEYVVPFRLVYPGALRPNPDEVEEGAYFELPEIRRRLQDQPDQFTPHFRRAFEKLVFSGNWNTHREM